jgi:hypothetical protein
MEENAMDGFLPEGRMISASKSGYIMAHPDNLVAFNAQICPNGKDRIWCGDLDVTADAEALKRLAAGRGEDLYVFRESAKLVPFDAGEAIAVVSAGGIKVMERA